MRARWYEVVPEVYYFISKVENVQNADIQMTIAEVMLKEYQTEGIKIDKNQLIFWKKLKQYSMGRWYDKNRYLSLAFEILKDCNRDTQKKLAEKFLGLFHDFLKLSY